jgi:drug/metabolite transporter (DMT)-like permease
MLEALFAAALFGASAPISKILLAEVEPVSLAAFLYLGCGAGMFVVRVIQRWFGSKTLSEAGLRKDELRWLAGAVVTGGVLAPIALLFGLRNTPAATASLLLNFEGVATVLIAAILFRESAGCRVLWAVACVTLAGILLTWNPGNRGGFSMGAFGVIAACGFWGIDNNLTRNISAKDPLQIVMIKGLCAGSFSLLLALFLRQSIPRMELVLKAMALGSVSYGLSVVLFVYSMRGLGVGRTSALFGTAPLAGAAISFLLFSQIPDSLFLLSLTLMVAGTFLLMKEKHVHAHFHEPVSHEHRHWHDDGHHSHGHLGLFTDDEGHSHIHQHLQVRHEHPHMPDIHHRHCHKTDTAVVE